MLVLLCHDRCEKGGDPVRITGYTDAVKEELLCHEITCNTPRGAEADGPVPRALLPPEQESEGRRPGARRLRGHRVPSTQARRRRGPGARGARPAEDAGAGDGPGRALRPARCRGGGGGAARGRGGG